jgi:hypothetical protein
LSFKNSRPEMQDTILELSTWKTVQSGQNAPGTDDMRQSDPDAYHLAVKAYEKEWLRGNLGGPFAVRWMVLYHPPDCRGFFQRMLVIRWGPLRLPSGDFTNSDGEAGQHLLMTHYSGCQPIEEHHSSGQVLQQLAQENWNLASEVVSDDKVRWFWYL